MAEGTSESSVFCRFFSTSSCTKGNTCKYSHNMPDVLVANENTICRYFLRGFCRDGDYCQYSHLSPASRANPEIPVCEAFLRNACYDEDNCPFPHTLSSRGEERNITCHYFLRGVCCRGDGCPFFHASSSGGIQQQRATCKFFLRGRCRFGNKCRHSHHQYDQGSANPNEPFHQQQNAASLRARETTAKQLTSMIERQRTATEQESIIRTLKLETNSATSEVEQDQKSLNEPSATEMCPFFDSRCPELSICPFDHGQVCELCLESRLHPFDEEQRKIHKANCKRAAELSRDKICSICYENVSEKLCSSQYRFGILESCTHIFCLLCIKEWRKKGQSTDYDTSVHPLTTRGCPECRTLSSFVTPSRYWVVGEEKRTLISGYKMAMKGIPCKYYASYGTCPFRDGCFYLHSRAETLQSQQPAKRPRFYM